MLSVQVWPLFSPFVCSGEELFRASTCEVSISSLTIFNSPCPLTDWKVSSDSFVVAGSNYFFFFDLYVALVYGAHHAMFCLFVAVISFVTCDCLLLKIYSACRWRSLTESGLNRAVGQQLPTVTMEKPTDNIHLVLVLIQNKQFFLSLTNIKRCHAKKILKDFMIKLMHVLKKYNIYLYWYVLYVVTNVFIVLFHFSTKFYFT